jgi:2,5-diketo-D-gluconate reductase B
MGIPEDVMQSIDLNGRKMPSLGLGTWQLSGGACERAVRLALDIGYRHIDTAELYGNEAEIGRAVAASGIDRQKIFITTKIWTNHLRARDVGPTVETSLKKLRTDYVDLLLIHWPNESVPLGETLGAMRKLHAAGKTLAIGVSNFPVNLMREARETHKAPIVCNQVEYHVRLDQSAVLDYARRHDIAVVAYCPLGRGNLVRNPALARIGAKHGKSAAQVALRWLIQQDGVAAIPKSATDDNLRANFDIFDFKLDREDLKAIAALSAKDRLVDIGGADWD